MKPDANKLQRDAANPGASVFVTANAGSGKTKVLVDRIARLLLQGSRPSAFLCITYTKAAAAEMQRRLFERLGAWCVADDATLADELSRLGAPEADLGVARALFARALETPGGLKIQTIHAFSERLLARFPLEAGIAPGFDIADEARAAALLARARSDAVLGRDAPQAAFDRFAARLYGDALDRFLDRLALRRADFRRFADKHDGGAFADAYVRNRHGARENDEAYAARVLVRVDWAGLENAAEVLSRSGSNDQKAAARIRAALSLRANGASRRAQLDAVLKIALKDDGEVRDAIATKSCLKENPWIAPALDALLALAPEASARLAEIDRAEDAASALALALTLDRAYEAAKHQSGVLDFDDLIAAAHALLSRSDAAPWVLYKLDGGLDHILIDEGQDTSPSQWDLVTPLMDEFFAGAGARVAPRTMFAVGDPKQSIYAFQGADPDRFLREAQALEKRSRRAKQPFSAPALEVSFRSSPEILHVVDAVFADRDLAPGAPEKFNEVRHLASREQQGGVVEVWPLVRRPTQTDHDPWDLPLDVETERSVHAVLARQIAKRARAWVDAGEAVWDKNAGKLRPIGAGDILALVRTRGALFRELIKAFKREGFPVAGADRMTLHDELVVEDCLALMRVALDPYDDLALACVLKGPWCGLDNDDTDLFPLAYGRAKGESLYARLLAATDPKYSNARAFVEALIARAGVDAFAFLSWALETPHHGGPTGWELVFARLGLESRDPLEELLQRAIKPSAYAPATLQRFLYEIEIDSGQVKRELEAESGAVRVMTVHGAKGLEAPVVILPDCTGPASDKPDDGLIFDAEMGPFVVRGAKGDDDATAKARAVHEERMEGEHWRLLYVAMTRARDRLVVCGAQHGNSKAGETPVSWRAAVETAMRGLAADACDTPFGEGLRIGALLTAATDITAPAAVTELPRWAKSSLVGAARVETAAPSRVAHVNPALFSPRGDGQRRFRRGRLIHGLLERLPDVAPERREQAAHAWLARQGVNEEDARLYAREAMNVIEDMRFAALFGAKSRAEAPIVGVAAGRPVRGVVDRLAVDDERVMVLDYKTDRPAPHDAADAPRPYVTQLALYREVLRAVFPGKRVECALLWTESPRLMELPQAQLDAAFAQFAGG
jgi:ATP-dependent helicase/nuclease subunit A